jgi:hypothetical protein
MKQGPESVSPKQSLLLILVPMLATFTLLRLYLHVMGVRHIYPGGHLIHHLFLGILIVIPAAFLLAFPSETHAVRCLVRVALGIGSALALDEISYLALTAATDRDYVSRLSLTGGIVLVGLGVVLLLALYFAHRD